MKPGKRDQNKRANRAAILDAARQAFLEQGYEAVTIRDVVRHTELASGTFYNYFRTKQDLLRALVDDYVQDLGVELRRVREAARSLDEFVHGAYLAIFTRIAQDPSRVHLMMRNEAAVRSLHAGGVMGLSTRALREDIEDAIRRGIMPPLDAGLLAAALLGAGYEIGRTLAASPKPDPAAAAAFATRLFLGGVHAFASDQVTTLKPRVRAAN